MNDRIEPMEYVERLAELARREQTPRGDVVAGALTRLRGVEASPLVRPWSVCAAGAAVMAALAAISLVAGYGSLNQDPILVLFKVASINL